MTLTHRFPKPVVFPTYVSSTMGGPLFLCLWSEMRLVEHQHLLFHAGLDQRRNTRKKKKSIKLEAYLQSMNVLLVAPTTDAPIVDKGK